MRNVGDFFRSMAGRVFIILVGGVLLATALTSWLANEDRQRAINQFRETRLLDQAELFVATLDAIPTEGRPAFLNTAPRFGLHAELLAQMPAPEAEEQGTTDFMHKLSERLQREFPLVALP